MGGFREVVLYRYAHATSKYASENKKIARKDWIYKRRKEKSSWEIQKWEKLWKGSVGKNEEKGRKEWRRKERKES